jgi:hypothetical protein
MMFYKPQYFILQEFVGPDVFENYGERAWQFLDARAVKYIDQFREFVGRSITINNWHSGGHRKESGLRIPGYENYKWNSQHTFGRAFDHIVDGIPSDEVQQIWIDNAERFEVGGIELAPTWTHTDWRASGEPVIFRP